MLNEEDQINCPYCAERILAKAKKCKHCGEVLDHQMREIEILKQQKNLIVNNNNNNNSSNAVGKIDYPWGWHLILTILTGGMWLFVWLILYLSRNKNIYN